MYIYKASTAVYPDDTKVICSCLHISLPIFIVLSTCNALTLVWGMGLNTRHCLLQIPFNFLKKSHIKSIILKEETDFIEPQLLRNHTKSEIFYI